MEAVGWMLTVLSKSALVAPIFMPRAKPCVISPALGPQMCLEVGKWQHVAAACNLKSYEEGAGRGPQTGWRA